MIYRPRPGIYTLRESTPCGSPVPILDARMYGVYRGRDALYPLRLRTYPAKKNGTALKYGKKYEQWITTTTNILRRVHSCIFSFDNYTIKALQVHVR